MLKKKTARQGYRYISGCWNILRLCFTKQTTLPLNSIGRTLDYLVEIEGKELNNTVHLAKF